VPTTCTVYEDDHWHNEASPDLSARLASRWADAGGDDDVIWIELEHEHTALTAKFEACVAGKRAASVAALRERGHPEDAARVEDLDPHVLERKLLDMERKNIIAERVRRHGRTRRAIDNMRAV
jgi:hypothetical protein